jgi:hypothetical protein
LALEPAGLGGEPLGRAGLGEERVAAGGEGAIAVLVEGARRQDGDRQAAGRRPNDVVPGLQARRAVFEPAGRRSLVCVIRRG